MHQMKTIAILHVFLLFIKKNVYYCMNSKMFLSLKIMIDFQFTLLAHVFLLSGTDKMVFTLENRPNVCVIS